MSKKHYPRPVASKDYEPEPVMEEVLDEVVEEIVEEVIEEPVVEAQKVAFGKVVNCSLLNVRKAPSAKAEILCTIPVNVEVIIDEEGSTGDFYKVGLESGVEGFCMKKFVAPFKA